MGRGVLLYVRQSFQVMQNNEGVPRETENLWIKIGRNSNEIIFGICYKCPDASKNEVKDLYSEMRQFSRSKTVLIMGDFNTGEID